MGSLGVVNSKDIEIGTVIMKSNGRKRSGASKEVNWERFGLSDEQAKTSAISSSGHSQGEGRDDEQDDGSDKEFCHGTTSQENELFAEDLSSKSKPWWKANFFLRGPVLFGTWDGVFTTCMINILGVIVFLRSGWMVAEAGMGLAVLVIFTAVLVILATVFAAIGICARCQVERGGVYFLISHVLGAKIGGSVGLIYCFGQAVGAAIHAIGFGETMGQVLNISGLVWVERAIAAAMLLVLIVINVVGVTWVIKVQFVLLIILLLAVLDFAVGSFVHFDADKGFYGYSSIIFLNNTGPQYTAGTTWFTVFGVFFPTLTGILGGINMSGDLHNPSRDIPVGTVSAVGVGTFLYLVFILILGSTCSRAALSEDYMIAHTVSAVGVFFLAGVYVASLSSCLGSLFGNPRVLQCIASENVIPFLSFLGRGRGPNKVPVIGILVISLITLIFIMIGDINTLAPVVTMPFMLTYATIEYAYFSLCKTFDIQQKREERLRNQGLLSPTFEQSSPQTGATSNYGATQSRTGYVDPQGGDLDTLFPERARHRPPFQRQQSSQASSMISSPDEHSSVQSAESKGSNHTLVTAADPEVSKTNVGAIAANDAEDTAPFNKLLPRSQARSSEIFGKPHNWYNRLSNRWISLLGMLCNLLIMFLVNWIYALVNILVMVILYFYISRANPGVFPGIAEFRLIPWLASGLKRLCGKSSHEYDHIVVTPMHPGVEVMAAQLTEDNEDYLSRERYHHSSMVQPSKFDDFDDD